MKTTKIVSLLLALIMVLSLFVACAPDGEVSDTTGSGNTTVAPDDSSTPPTDAYETITIKEALDLCGEPGDVTVDRYYIRATVVSIDNAQYGQMTIADDTGTISVYGTYSADGAINYSEMTDKPYRGDEVLLYCILQNYNGTKEVKNARLIEFKRVEVEIDESKYTSMSIAEARGKAKGELVRVDGVVARITYAFGMVPSGVYLIDETSSIYVYDADLAQRVAIGNKIEILANKTYWILDSEQSNAQKFGYGGCCQLDSVTLISNDEKTNEFDRSWITESTVKDMLDTPLSVDFTTLVYKVNALVKKVEGKGFVNYYFNDIDGVTGSYVYTQCSGSDFAWLDKFDGKICTVYLTVMNAKATGADCIYRLYPIAVEDNGYTFNKDEGAKYAVKYHGIPQFMPTYSGDPALELVTSASSTLLGLDNIALSYSSSNTGVATFTEKDGKMVMNCVGAGKTTITVSASFNGKSYSETYEIEVTIPQSEIPSISVGEAISSANGKAVTIKGIVGPSLVNQTGFYLIDDSGVIAVLIDADSLATLKIGNEVILTGTRSVKTKGGDGYFGQSYIADAQVVVNNYGTHEYSTKTFITDKTLADFYALDPKTDYSTSVYVLKATVNVVEAAYYTNIELVSGSTKVSLYCSSANQYNWLKAFAGKEITVEVAACNWNDKTYWRGCVLAAYTEDGKVLNTLNFGS